MQRVHNIILSSRSVVAGVFLFIISLYYINISLFLHYHIVDGVTIVHSHIYSDDHAQNPNDQDAHSKSELTLIQSLSNYFVDSLCETPLLGIAYRVVYNHYTISNEYVALLTERANHTLRGPPAKFTIG